ncbi:MAG: radical SAM protein [Vulcanimicrobiota bacterium]
MIGVSIGTASLLGLSRSACEVYPTTAHLMTGSSCMLNCAFCAQARRSQAGSQRLSRVSWPLFETDDVFRRLAMLHEEGTLKRACIQVVNSRGVFSVLEDRITRLRRITKIPLSVAANCLREREMDTLFSRGVDVIGIPLDCATDSLYRTVKEGRWSSVLDRLLRAAHVHPGRVATHLIAGLGETEEELVRTMECLYENGIPVGLFAFTPIRGTAMADRRGPGMASYRRIQYAHHLLKKGHGGKYTFKKGKLFFCENMEELKRLSGCGEAFQTSGCPGCNRPYYNERPGKSLYNYPRPLLDSECEEALSMLLDHDEEQCAV